MIPAVAAAIKRVEKLIEARPTTTLGASYAECQAYERDVLTPAVAERDRIVREAERDHRRVVAESLVILEQDIAAAQTIYRNATENFGSFWPRLQPSFKRRPDPDPQIQQVMRTGNLRHAAELLAGKRQVEAAVKRDQAIADAHRRHDARSNP